jgi:nucleoside-diphosphate-sugar epimerase
MRIAVTGATGFIGQNLCRHLHKRGHEVVALVRSPAPELEADGIGVRIGDVTDAASLAAGFQGADAVIHLAAFFNRPGATPDEYRAVNVEGALNVAAAARSCGARRLIHCSTVGVALGGPAPHSESSPYAPPAWDSYETTKAEGERAILDFSKEKGFPVVVVRPAQVYGPGDRSKAKFYKLVKKGILIRPGSTLKHLIYIDDLCRAFELCLDTPAEQPEIFIIAGRAPTPLSELIEIAARELGVPKPRIFLPGGPVVWLCAAIEKLARLVGVNPPVVRRSMDFFVRGVEFDVSKAKDKLGFESSVDVETGVARTVAWYREEGIV